MPHIQVILQGARIASYDIQDFPIVLQFGDQRSYSGAVWYIPAFSMRIPTRNLSEIRSQQGSFTVIVDGPEGFSTGTYPATWIRAFYPRGKDCSIIYIDPETHTYGGISLSTVEDSLIIDTLPAAKPKVIELPPPEPPIDSELPAADPEP